MMKTIALIFISLIMTISLSSCGGGGGGSSNTTPPPPPPPAPPAHALAGTWFGTLEDVDFVLHALEVTVADDGSLSSILVDGINDGVTGTITGNITHSNSTVSYALSFSDNSSGGITVDSSSTHLSFIDDNFSYAVLQKDAVNTLPTYSSDELVGTWTGFGVILDSSLFISGTFSANVTVDGNYNFTGSDDASTFTGVYLSGDTNFGRFTYDVINSNNEEGKVTILVSPDKSFFTSYTCPAAGYSNFITECSFTNWE